MTTWPNRSLESTQVGRYSFAYAVDIVSSAWLDSDVGLKKLLHRLRVLRTT
jgi:hypothetical protein